MNVLVHNQYQITYKLLAKILLGSFRKVSVLKIFLFIQINSYFDFETFIHPQI